MKKILLTTICLAFATFSFSQVITRDVSSSGGNYSTSAAYSFSSTIGEPMISTFTGTGFVFTQGFQQSFSSPLKPAIAIVSPMDGASFTTTNSVTVGFDLTDFVVAAGTADDHIHYYVNGAMTMKYDTLAIPLTNLANGNHVVIMQLVDNAHQPFTPNVADTVSFSVNIINGCTDSTAFNYDPLANTDDGSCIPFTYGCTDPAAYNYDGSANTDDGSCVAVLNGCTDPAADNYYADANTDDGSCIIAGCIDPAATNYDATATVGDESCTYSACDSSPTGINMWGITDTRFYLGWDNMNTASCMVLKYHVRFRSSATATSAAGSWTTKSAGAAGNGQCNFGLNNVEKLMINFDPSTKYDVRMRTLYCSDPNPATGWTAWSSIINVTTAGSCPDLANMEVQTFNGQQNKAKFTWDTTGVYVFARLYTRVNGGSAPFDWTVQGGFGIDYPAFHKNIFTFNPGETYRVQGNSFCSATMSSFRGNLTPVVIWTQPVGSSKLESNGTAINNLDIYPNPSRDMFNISFTSEEIQNLRVRIMNVIGEELINDNLEQFIGEYTKQINLSDNAKGIYFLEITTNKGLVNMKLILQ